MRVRVIVAALAAAVLAAPAASAADRYALAGGCYALKAAGTGSFVAKSGDGYAATVADAGAAEPLRLKATALGRYLLFGAAGDFVASDGGDGVVAAAGASERADWEVDVLGSAFKVTLPAAGRALAVGGDGRLVLAGEPARFEFVATSGCAEFPEAELNVSGEPLRGPAEWSEVRGFTDPHFHWLAFEFLGGSAHCGRPWHPYGIAHALVDCPDHEPNGEGAVLENVLATGSPVGTHDTDGWPTFAGWPRPESLTHEGSYHRWVERAWRAGLRLTTVLYVDNAILCEVYPYKRNSCDEMESIRLQARQLRALIDYIDAQAGGPGKGWLQIVTDPFEARRVINEGKLAVIQGIESSRLFHCREFDGESGCDTTSIDAGLEEMYDLGVRQMEIVNKFDNALTGVAGDSGTTGLVVNNGNKLETNHYWRMSTCEGLPEHAHDRTQPTAPSQVSEDPVFTGVVENYLPSGQTPIYSAGPHCNEAGLTPLGEHLIERMIEKGMIFDPDHMSARARVQALDVLERHGHSGVISSHSWSTPDAYPRILALGGMITPITGRTEGFIEEMQLIKPLAPPRYFYGTGFGSDINGLHSMPPARNPESNPVTYPFKSFDGGTTLERPRAGTRTWDVNTDGVAHYGLLPDWIEDLRLVGGPEVVEDLARGAEAYLQMWERSVGVDGDGCAPRSARLGPRGLRAVRLGSDPEALVRRAGQPSERAARHFRFCVDGAPTSELVAGLSRRGRVRVVATTARGHRAGRVRPGDRASALRGHARRLGRGLHARRTGKRRAFVYRVRGGRVRYAAVAPRSLARRPARLRAALRAARLP